MKAFHENKKLFAIAGGAMGALALCVLLLWRLDGRPLRPSPTARTEPATAANQPSGGSSAKPNDGQPQIASQTPGEPSEREAPPERDYFVRLQSLYRTDKEAALEWARSGEDWYGDASPHTDARRAVAITALVDLGRMKQARREVREFIERHPDSRYRPLVQGVTGIHPRPGAPPHIVSAFDSSDNHPNSASSSKTSP